MLKYFSVFIIVFFASITASPAFADDGVIGTILEVEGSATVMPSGGSPSAAAVNTTVHLNDTVQTDTASRVFILFIDNTQLTLSEDTRVKIDNYIFDPDDNRGNKASYSVLQGAFQYVSGLIGKKENPDVHIDTPVGSIGIRGTDFWGGNLDNQYSVAVNDGQVALKTDAGEEVVNKGQGTSVKDRHSIPEHAHVWPREKFQRISNTVHLKRQGLVRQKIKAMQGHQRIMQRRYKNYVARHGSPHQRRGGNLHNQQQKHTSWHKQHGKRQQHRRTRQNKHRQDKKRK